MENKKLKVGSLYAGVGGICLGFKNAGFDISWANEYDKNACITYRENFEHNLIEGDVMQVPIKSLDEIDVLAGGFPCQPFSIEGHRKGFEDHRGNHFFRMLDFVDELRPKVLFFENVKHLVSHDNGNTFNVIKNEIVKRGYTLSAKVLNTKEYGNIPHNRERIFIVAFDPKQVPTFELFAFPEKIALKKTIHDILEKGKQEDRYYLSEDHKHYPELDVAMVSRDTVYQWRRGYVRENKNRVCPALLAAMGKGGLNVPLIRDSFGIRKLTPRDCFSLQGFPNDYNFPKIATYHLYKQSGNSVSVSVIQRIADNILKTINGIDCLQGLPQLRLELRSSC